jgi:hypothetical protein
MSFQAPLNQVTNFRLPPGGQLILPFEKGSAVTSLPVFCASHGQAAVLEMLTQFMEGEDFQFITRACPSTQQQSFSNTIPANQTYEDQISVPAGSFLIMIGGISTDPVSGFRVFLYDAGAQAPLCDAFVNGNCISGNFTQLPQTGTGMLTTVSGNKNLFILPAPIAMASPGQLNVQIVNLSQASATIEMAFIFAAPIAPMGKVEPSWVGNSVGR